MPHLSLNYALITDFMPSSWDAGYTESDFYIDCTEKITIKELLIQKR